MRINFGGGIGGGKTFNMRAAIRAAMVARRFLPSDSDYRACGIERLEPGGGSSGKYFEDSNGYYYTWSKS